MKQLIVAFGLVIAVEVICYFVLNSFSVPAEFRNIILGLVLAAFTPIHQTLKEHSRQPRFSTEPSMVVSLTGYGLPWHMLYVYATLIVLAITLLAGAIGGLLAAIASIKPNSLFALNILSGLFVFVANFFLGRWVGVRYSGSFIGGILVVVAFVVTAVTIDKIFSFIVIPEGTFLEIFGVQPTLQSFWVFMIFAVPLHSVFGVLGFWRGRVTRIGNYLYFLLKRLPKDTQTSFIDLVYQEAKNQSTGGLTPHSSG